MSHKTIPLEAVIVLQNNLHALPPRSEKRQLLIKETAELFGVSESSIRRALRKHYQPHCIHRNDYNEPRIISQADMKRYCELIAALKLRTTNKKGRHLSTKECIRLLEEHGVTTAEGLIKTPSGLLKRSTIERYLNRWGYDSKTMNIEPPSVPFEAIYSNDCWQFDFSPSDLKKLKDDHFAKHGDQLTLMFASVVDDRSGYCYQEYHCVYGEDTITALRFLFNAMAPKKYPDCPFQGIPKMIYLDNGPVAKSNLFRQVMAHLGVEVRTHMPKGSDGRRTTSRAKGKVERQFRTVKDTLETLYHFHEPTSLEEANEWLRQYLQRCNAMQHRHEAHSRLDDWLKNLPGDGYREMCSWERFCTFARDPEQRKAESDACVSVDGVRYQLSHDMAGQEVTLLWGLFDNELYVEFNSEKHGPFYPAAGPIPLGTFRKSKKSNAEKRADHIGELAQQISVPRSALSNQNRITIELLSDAKVTQQELPRSTPFKDNDPLQPTHFKNRIDAKSAIAEFLGHPLARLTPVQMEEVNRILEETLDKKTVLAQVRCYFTLSLQDRPGEDLCTGK